MPYNDLLKPRLLESEETIGALTFVVPATMDVLAIESVHLEAGADVLDLGSFESGTQLKIEPVVRTSNNGVVRIVAHKLTGTLISVNNNPQFVAGIYDTFTNRKVQMDVNLTPSGLADTTHASRLLNFSRSDRFMSSSTEFDNRVSLTYTTEVTDDYRIRLVISVTAWIQNIEYCRYPL